VIYELKLFETKSWGKSITNLNNLFLEIIKTIGEQFDIKNPLLRKISLAKEPNDERISDYGPGFGVQLEPAKIILAKWLFELPKREKENILQMILVREAFRCFLDKAICVPKKYWFFVEVVLNIIAIVWLAHTFQYSYCHPVVIDMRGRIVFDNNNEMKSNNWEWFLIDCIKYNISVKEIFNQLIEVLQDNLEEKRPLKEVARKLEKWYEQQKEELDYSLLPLKLEPRHYQIIKALVDLGATQASAKKVGEVIGKSYNVANKNFIDLTDTLDVYWRAEINDLFLKLYPHRFEVQILKKASLNILVKQFKQIPYIREIDLNSQDYHNISLAGLLISPLIVKNNLQVAFERLQRKGQIGDFFIDEIRRKRIFCAVTTQNIARNEKSVQTILESPELIRDLVVLNLLDKRYDFFTEHKEKSKLVLDENLLTFLALIRARYLGKAHYMLAELSKIYQLAKKNNIDSTDSRMIKNFVNQLEIRCRRLGLLDYYLNIRSIGNFSKYLYLRIMAKSTDKELQNFICKIKYLSGTGAIILDLPDKLLVQFPKAGLDSILHQILSEELAKLNVEFSWQNMSYYRAYVPPLSLEYYKYYDFKAKRWKI